MGEFEKIHVTPSDKEFTTITINTGTVKTDTTPRTDSLIKTEGTNKRKRTANDEPVAELSEETVCEIIATIDDPKYMTGPNVSI